NDFDIFRVFFFTPSIEEKESLRRLYHLMRRYQPSAFALFRTDALSRSVEQTIPVSGKVFQELMFMTTLVLQGAIARLPVIFNLHGAEESFNSTHERHPLYWFLRDSGSFFRHYAMYRDALAAAIRTSGALPQGETNLEHLL